MNDRINLICDKKAFLRKRVYYEKILIWLAN